MEYTKTLFFVYNAKSGVINLAFDGLHKLFSPNTYQCQLCCITNGIIGVKRQWEDFINEFPGEIEYFHKDEWILKYPQLNKEKHPSFPAIYQNINGEIIEVIKSKDLDTMLIDDLIKILNHL